jgi:hypothetical protein
MNFWHFLYRSFLIVALSGMMLAYLIHHSYTMKINYEKLKIENQLKELRQENDLLEIDAAKMTSLSELDSYAKNKLNMYRPTQIEYIILPKE